MFWRGFPCPNRPPSFNSVENLDKDDADVVVAICEPPNAGGAKPRVPGMAATSAITKRVSELLNMVACLGRLSMYEIAVGFRYGKIEWVASCMSMYGSGVVLQQSDFWSFKIMGWIMMMWDRVSSPTKTRHGGGKNRWQKTRQSRTFVIRRQNSITTWVITDTAYHPYFFVTPNRPTTKKYRSLWNRLQRRCLSYSDCKLWNHGR